MSKEQEKAREYLKKYRLFLLFGIYLILQLLVLGVEKITHSVLRSVPQMLLSWFGILSALLLLWGLGKMFCEWGYKKQIRAFSIIKRIWYVLVGILGVGVILIGLFFSVFKYRPEHVVEHNGVRMVASVNSFLQEQVSYYEYKNFLFRGSIEIGYEDYGNGGRDPLENENREPIYQHFGE